MMASSQHAKLLQSRMPMSWGVEKDLLSGGLERIIKHRKSRSFRNDEEMRIRPESSYVSSGR
jgi:hypothetical protein